jgi:hypothetical protein
MYPCIVNSWGFGDLTISAHQNDSADRTLRYLLTVCSSVYSRMCSRRSSISTRHLRNRFKLFLPSSYIPRQWHSSWLLVTRISCWGDINNAQCHDAAPTTSSFKNVVRVTICHIPFQSPPSKSLYCEGVGFEPDIFGRFWPQDFGV